MSRTRYSWLYGSIAVLLVTLLAVFYGGNLSLAQSPPSLSPPQTLTLNTLAVSASWDAVSDATHYKVLYFESDGNASSGSELTTAETNILFSVPRAGSWTVRVTACDQNGCGQDAATLQVEVKAGATSSAKPTSKPPKPTGYTLETRTASLDISASWDATPDAEYYALSWRKRGLGFDSANKLTLQTNRGQFSVPDHGEWLVRLDACNDLGCTHVTKKINVAAYTKDAPVPQGFRIVPARDYQSGADDNEYHFIFTIPAHRDSGIIMSKARFCLEGTSPTWQTLYGGPLCTDHPLTARGYEARDTLVTLKRVFDGNAGLLMHQEYDVSLALVGTRGEISQSVTGTFTAEMPTGADGISELTVRHIGIDTITSMAQPHTTTLELGWETLRGSGGEVPTVARVCIDRQSDNSWNGAVCETIRVFLGTSSHRVTFGESPLVHGYVYEASVELLAWGNPSAIATLNRTFLAAGNISGNGQGSALIVPWAQNVRTSEIGMRSATVKWDIPEYTDWSSAAPPSNMLDKQHLAVGVYAPIAKFEACRYRIVEERKIKERCYDVSPDSASEESEYTFTSLDRSSEYTYYIRSVSSAPLYPYEDNEPIRDGAGQTYTFTTLEEEPTSTSTPGPIPVPSATPTPDPASTPTPTATATPTPTAEPVPVSTPDVATTTEAATLTVRHIGTDKLHDLNLPHSSTLEVSWETQVDENGNIPEIAVVCIDRLHLNDEWSGAVCETVRVIPGPSSHSFTVGEGALLHGYAYTASVELWRAGLDTPTASLSRTFLAVGRMDAFSAYAAILVPYVNNVSVEWVTDKKAHVTWRFPKYTAWSSAPPPNDDLLIWTAPVAVYAPIAKFEACRYLVVESEIRNEQCYDIPASGGGEFGYTFDGLDRDTQYSFRIYSVSSELIHPFEDTAPRKISRRGYTFTALENPPTPVAGETVPAPVNRHFSSSIHNGGILRTFIWEKDDYTPGGTLLGTERWEVCPWFPQRVTPTISCEFLDVGATSKSYYHSDGLTGLKVRAVATGSNGAVVHSEWLTWGFGDRVSHSSK